MQEICAWIKKEPQNSFLLPELLKRLHVPFATFERYLNQHFSLEENLSMRAKIVGKQMPRDAYQAYFPIGGGKMYAGPHTVVGHASPDMDTSIASFWGWVDAFGAKVSKGPHYWHLPGGELPSHAKELLTTHFGEAITSLIISELPEEGSVSLRDFSNRDEANISDRLKVISVIDHHPLQLKTQNVCTIHLADVQSCNVLVAEQALSLAASYPVHPRRDKIERTTLMHAILDDTDLLAKTTVRDLHCIANLLEVPFSSLDELLKHPRLQTLYQQICKQREEASRRDLLLCLEGKPSNVFVDTKEQKRSARVGQTKIFASQFPWFLDHVDAFRKAWLHRSTHFYEKKPHLNLHLQMISTLIGTQKKDSYAHTDELWIWVPSTQAGLDRLSTYLSAFKHAPEVQQHHIDVHLIKPSQELRTIFSTYFDNVHIDNTPDIDAPMAVIRFAPGKLTSRKTCITPYI